MPGPPVLSISLAGLLICLIGLPGMSILYSPPETSQDALSIEGEWVKTGPTGPARITFSQDGMARIDLGDDETIDLVSEYSISNNSVVFHDKEGLACASNGTYSFEVNEYYLAFDLVEDDCNGRIKTTMGFWTKPNFSELIEDLDKQIAGAPDNQELYLTRARVHIATGNTQIARENLDIYIKLNDQNAKAFINRAGTRFPFDMEGAVSDCDLAIALDSTNKNAYFLRGLARYELGEKQEACEDFTRAIELGFAILRKAEWGKCAEFWDQD